MFERDFAIASAVVWTCSILRACFYAKLLDAAMVQLACAR